MYLSIDLSIYLEALEDDPITCGLDSHARRVAFVASEGLPETERRWTRRKSSGKAKESSSKEANLCAGTGEGECTLFTAETKYWLLFMIRRA